MSSGISWPIDSTTGKASSTPVNKSVWIAALDALSSPESDALAAKIRGERRWRQKYVQLVHEVVVLQAGAAEDECLKSCRAGLDALNEALTFTQDGSVIGSAKEAMSKAGLEKFVTETKAGSGAAPKEPFAMRTPMGHAEPVVSGEALKGQAKAWSDYGCIEPSASSALSTVASMSDVSSLVKNKVFVLLGATSSLGPFAPLAKLGAKIACVARKGKKLEKLVAEAAETPATLLLPTRGGVAGADLIADAPAIADWILTLPARGEQIVLGCYAYLDGEKHVRASVAMDLIAEKVVAGKKGSALAYLVSPATSHAATDEAAEDSGRRYEETPMWHGLFRKTFGSFAKREFSTAEGTGIKVINGLSSIQGPNYALAKTSQQWRAMVAKADGAVVSANHAPAARTESMVGYATIAAALEGMQSFPPLVAYDPGTACDMMAAILLWDLTDSKSLASPKNPGNHPTDLLAENACHGGIWRCAYDMESVNTASFLFGRFQPSYTPAGSLSI